jgi:hypothetical protein
MKRQIFRQSSLDRLATPEELDKLIPITDLRGWISLLGTLGLILVILLWAIFGTIPTVLPADGILLRQNGIQDIRPGQAGIISELKVAPGDKVKENQTVALLRTEQGATLEVRSAFSGTVLEMMVEKDTPVTSQTVLTRLELTNQPLQAVLFVPLNEGKQLEAGVNVQLVPSGVRSEAYGYLLGKVESIASFPASTESLQVLIKNEQLVKDALANGPVLRVNVTLDKDASSFSGFKWSSSSGPHSQLSSGTPCQAYLTTGEQRPINLIFPFLDGERG